MENKFMKKCVLFIFAVVFCLSFVLAEGSWDSFEGGEDYSDVVVENLSDDLMKMRGGENESFEDFKLGDSSTEEDDSFEYTQYFYIALGVGVVGFLIVVLFIYLFLRHPKNRWNKKKILK